MVLLYLSSRWFHGVCTPESERQEPPDHVMTSADMIRVGPLRRTDWPICCVREQISSEQSQDMSGEADDWGVCADMIRVGPLRRIDRALLGHSLHSNARNKSEAAHELEEMLRQATSISETAVLKAELAQVQYHDVTLVSCQAGPAASCLLRQATSMSERAGLKAELA